MVTMAIPSIRGDSYGEKIYSSEEALGQVAPHNIPSAGQYWDDEICMYEYGDSS